MTLLIKNISQETKVWGGIGFSAGEERLIDPADFSALEACSILTQSIIDGEVEMHYGFCNLATRDCKLRVKFRLTMGLLLMT